MTAGGRRNERAGEKEQGGSLRGVRVGVSLMFPSLSVGDHRALSVSRDFKFLLVRPRERTLFRA